MKESSNSDELKAMAPTLFSIEKKEAFTVPAGYFDSLPDKVMDKIAADPLYSPSAQGNPFVVPENYFEGLPLDIIKKVEASQAKRFSLGGLLAQVLRPRYSMTLVTACFALLICVRFFQKPVSMSISETAEVKVTISDIEAVGDIDESTLMDEISETSAALLKTDNKSSSDKAMEDYIINNNIDLADIAKEL